MIQVKQTIMHDAEQGIQGNCLSAAIASLLHLDIAVVPMFDGKDWVKKLNMFLKPYGLGYLVTSVCLDEELESAGISGLYGTVSGHTNRFTNIRHACVGLDAEVVFDPHPDNTGLTDIDATGIFVVLEPWRLTEAYRSPDPTNSYRLEA